MSAVNARAAALEWVEKVHLPLELRGREVQLVVFTNEQDCRFFYPRRALPFQQYVNTELSKIIRGRRGKVRRVELTAAKYDEWRAKRDDNEDLRREFADGHLRLLEQSE